MGKVWVEPGSQWERREARSAEEREEVEQLEAKGNEVSSNTTWRER